LYGVLLFDDPVTGLALLGMGLILTAGIAAARLRQSVMATNAMTKSEAHSEIL